jgi:hypothetical protein
MVAGFSGALGALTFLAVHLGLEATGARAWMWGWMVVPIGLWATSAFALAIAAGADFRGWVRVLPAALLGYSPPGTYDARGAKDIGHAPHKRAPRGVGGDSRA